MKVVFVVGPTASGKSDLALTWAQKWRGAVVNCDSIQVYKSLNIGSAKPSKEDFQKVPHFLFDCVEEGEEITAGEYARDFHSLLEKIKDQFPVIFVVGGTGFYFQAIERGMYPVGASHPQALRQVEEDLARSPETLYQELVEKDPETAQKISSQDHYRLVRAIEMMRTHGRPVSAIKKEFEAQRKPFPYPLLKMGLRISKEQLMPRVQERTEKMLAQGLVAEVRALLDRGLESWAPLQSVGYRECLQFLQGSLSSEKELQDQIVQNTLRLAKKQRTWFQRDPEIFWLSPDSLEEAQRRLDDFLQEQDID